MNTLDEIIYYCNEPDPIGALMLTGEWGCGKTYLIEHELKDKLKNTHIIVRVSLFGIDSIDTLNMNVKKQWITQCTSLLGKITNRKKALSAGKTIFDGISSVIPILKDVKDTILSVNPLDYIIIKPVVEEKKVILIFDDLERSKLSTVDVLGCINEYCENYHFNTIIVANEDRLCVDIHDNISYSEIKEKIVARTIRHKPEFGTIIHSILQNRNWFDVKYKTFLNKNEQLILSVFETDAMRNTDNDDENVVNSPLKPHNIRSLQCALQDFHRVYEKLVKYDITNLEKYLYSFIAYTMATKAGIAAEGEYGFLFSDDKVKNLYPFFTASTLLSNVRKWILYGEWNEGSLSEELKYVVSQLKSSEPKDILRCNRFIEIDEDIIKSAFSDLIQDCYAGKFNLNDYVNLIENSFWCRRCNIELPESINWEKVTSGIEICFRRYIEENELENYTQRFIGKDSRKYFTENELRAYDMIAEFRNNNVVAFENNKRLYINSLQQEGLRAFNICRHKRVKAFDNDMADVTKRCFECSDQADKAYFSGYFEDMWTLGVDSYDIDLESTKHGFNKLKNDLTALKESYLSDGKNIAAYHTDTFIDLVDKLINRIDDRISKKGD